MKQILGLLAIAVLIFTGSCRKREDPSKISYGEVNFKFTNTVGTASLDLGKRKYTNAHGDTFTVANYVYYISNISLTTADGKTFNEPESYHLINEAKADSKSFTINNLPSGDYKSIKFMIGVDEARNTSGAQNGALDPINGMFWDWNTGYVMAKVEGTCSLAPSNIVAFHMGGYTGPNQVQRWVTLTLPANAIVAVGKSPVINLKSDVLEWFKTPTTIDFSAMSVITFSGEEAKKIADNYMDMFSIDRVDN